MYRLDRFKGRKKSYMFSLFPFAKIIDLTGQEENKNNDSLKAIVLNKDGSLQAIWTYRGPDLDSAIREQLGIMTVQLNSAFKALGTNHILYFEAQRSPSTQYPTDVFFPDLVTKKIDEERRQLFSSGGYYESNYYITLQWMPPSDKQGKLKELVVEGTAQEVFSAEDHIEKFKETVNKLFRIFASQRIPVNHMTANEIATYLHSTVSSKSYPINLPDQPVFLDTFLADDSLTGGLLPKLGDKYIAVVVPLAYTSISEFGLFNELNRLDFSYRWFTRFFCLDKADSLSVLGSSKREWNGKVKSFGTRIKEIFLGYPDNSSINESAMSKVNEIKEAAMNVEDDEIFYGYYSTAVIILDDDPNALKEKAKSVEQIFVNLGMKAKIEDLNGVDAWLGAIPGNVHHQVRHPLISTGNLVHMMPLSDIWAGPQYNKHLKAPCLLYTQTDGNTPFRLNLHVGDVGHTLIIGRTGAGKSVHLNMIAAQFRKYKDAQVFIFDKGASSRILTEAVGGQFYDIANERNGLSFQPLSQIDDENERIWVLEWLYDFLRGAEVTVTPEVKKVLVEALDSMSSMPVERRTMSLLVSNVQDKPLRLALEPLSLGGNTYGAIFDSDKDNLTFSSWQSFEMEKLMNLSSLVGPVLMYIFHRIEQQLTGRPTIIILDEAWVRP